MRTVAKKIITIGIPAVALSTSLITYGALTTKSVEIPPQNRQKIVQDITAQAPNLRPNVLNLALNAYEHAREQGKDRKGILTVVDYNLPSSKKRLWVINLNNDKVEYNTLVAQGKNTGLNFARHFSNRAGSDESSLGTFETGNTYSGEHGYSLRLHGLNPQFNGNAFNRAVVMHSAWYVSKSFDEEHGRIGRSWGCFAMSKKMEPKVVNAIKGGTIIFAYFPNQAWLNSSPYVKPVA